MLKINIFNWCVRFLLLFSPWLTASSGAGPNQTIISEVFERNEKSPSQIFRNGSRPSTDSWKGKSREVRGPSSAASLWLKSRRRLYINYRRDVYNYDYMRGFALRTRIVYILAAYALRVGDCRPQTPAACIINVRYVAAPDLCARGFSLCRTREHLRECTPLQINENRTRTVGTLTRGCVL